MLESPFVYIVMVDVNKKRINLYCIDAIEHLSDQNKIIATLCWRGPIVSAGKFHQSSWIDAAAIKPKQSTQSVYTVRC